MTRLLEACVWFLAATASLWLGVQLLLSVWVPLTLLLATGGTSWLMIRVISGNRQSW